MSSATTAITPFDALDRNLADGGPDALLDEVAVQLEGRGEFRALLDLLLLRARHDLGLPLVADNDSGTFPEPARTKYEDRYVEAIRAVGSKLLALGDLPGAWPYFRTIGEPGPIAKALDEAAPSGEDDKLSALIEVAFNQGANPRKGFAWILEHYGTCSAITAFENLPRDESVRVDCAGRLVRQLHNQLVANLRAEVGQRGQPLPPEGTPIPVLIEGRDWLFSDEAYHIDVSHLASVVRIGPMLTDPEILALAVELTEYGRKLSGRHVYDGDPPFDRTYDDHDVYLRALIGDRTDADKAVAHFRSKLVPDDPDAPPDSIPAQVLVNLLVRLGRLEEAIDLSVEHLAGVPESMLFCPTLAQLCQRTNQPGRLARVARDRGDLVAYASALLGQSGSPELNGMEHDGAGR